MNEQDSPNLAVRLAALALIYGIGLVGLYSALNKIFN